MSPLLLRVLYIITLAEAYRKQFRSTECINSWNDLACNHHRDTTADFCDPNGRWGHIAIQCRKACNLCDLKPPGSSTSTQSTTTENEKTETQTNTPSGITSSTSAPKPLIGCPSGCPKGKKCMINHCVMAVKCPEAPIYGDGPPSDCPAPSDPLNKPKSKLESWFTKEVFEDLFPKANIGWGLISCWPYSYESFIIAARYFPDFGTVSPNSVYTPEQNHKRDLATLFSHIVQETGENDASLYESMPTKAEADACFYRGGFFNWFEGGPVSSFLPKDRPGFSPQDGALCNQNGRYCQSDSVNKFFYPCNQEKNGSYFKGCYFGRGAIQISYNYNYGQLSSWLNQQGIEIDLLKDPWKIMTKMDPPIAVLASLWFYMTPQPPKPAMHDIIMGSWNPGDENRAAGCEGPIFGPTSLIINNECGGEDEKDPGGPGESRRIKAFKWFTEYFGVPVGPEKTLTCKQMPKKLESIRHNLTYAPDWSTTWKSEPCQCAPATYAGIIPYFQKGFYPQKWVDLNIKNKKRCEDILYSNPKIFSLSPGSACLKVKPFGSSVEKASPF